MCLPFSSLDTTTGEALLELEDPANVDGVSVPSVTRMDGCSACKNGVGTTGTEKPTCCKAVPAGGELGPGFPSTDVIGKSTVC